MPVHDGALPRGHLRAGQLVVRRGFVGPRLIGADLARVVDHTEDHLLIWFAPETEGALSVATDGRGIRDMPFAEWLDQEQVLIPNRRGAFGLMMFIPVGEAHSVWWQWKPDGRFWGWYVNLEEPSVLWDDGTLAGVDTTDHDLDLWVLPDRTCRWKDEGELAERAAFGDRYWVDDPDAVRREAARVAARVDRGEFPFDGNWCDFTPDPNWTWPSMLPDGWDRPRAG